MAAICGLQLPSIRFFGMPQVLLPRWRICVCWRQGASDCTKLDWDRLDCLELPECYSPRVLLLRPRGPTDARSDPTHAPAHNP
jgi:hypothetical protein